VSRQRPRPLLVRRVNLLWYPATLLPILALLFATLAGYLPPLLAILALFLLIFWLSSLLFAIYVRLRKPKDPSP
jgi:hypothetical protein